MNKKHLRLFALLLILLMLTACGKESTPQAQPTTAPTTKAVQSAYDLSESEETMEYSLWAHAWNMYGGASPDGVLAFLEQKFNIKFKLGGAPEDQYTNKIELVVNGGEVPDMFYYSGSDSQLSKWAEDGMVLPLEPLVEAAGAQHLKALLESNQVKNATFNGMHYKFPRVVGENSNVLFVRKDWMNRWIAARGLDVTYPETMEQFADMLKYFTEEDPDGNGEDDTVGFATSSNIGWLKHFLAAFNLQPGWTLNPATGIYERTVLNERYQDYLAFFRMLYENRWMYQDFNAINHTRALNLFTSGKAGVLMYNNGASVDHVYNQMSTSSLKGIITDEASYMQYVDIIPMPNGAYPGAYAGTTVYNGGWCISADAEEPLRLIRLLDYLISPEGQLLCLYGVEGYHYTKNEDGTISPKVDVRGTENNRWQITDLTSGYLGGKYMLGVYFVENQFRVDENNDVNIISDYYIYRNKNLLKKAFDLIADGELNYSIGYDLQDFSANYYEKLSMISDEEDNTFILVVTGQKPLEEQMTAMKARFDSLGYAEVEAEYNQKVKDAGLIP